MENLDVSASVATSDYKDEDYDFGGKYDSDQYSANDNLTSDEYTSDGKFVYGSTTNCDNSYKFCLITDHDEEEDYNRWDEVPDKEYSLAAYDVNEQSLVDSIEYKPLDKHDYSQGWHCVACVGDKDETTIVLAQLTEFKAFRFVDGKFQRAEIHCDELLRVGYEADAVRRLKITRDEKDAKYQMEVTRFLTMRESIVRTFDVDIA